MIVTQSKQWSLDGLALLLSTIRDVRHYYDPRLDVAGFVPNLHEEHTSAGRHWVSELGAAAAANDLRLLEPFVPKRQPIADAIDYGQGLDEGDSKARALADIYSAHLAQFTEGGRK